MMMITYGFFMRTYYDIALAYLSSSWRLVLRTLSISYYKEG